MIVYRLCKKPFTKLDGEGARLYGGRWNSKGKPVVYSSGSLSLAVLELLVHIDSSLIPNDMVSLEIKIPDKSSKETFPDMDAPIAEIASTFGDAWIDKGDSLIYEVPSAIVPEKNILLNPTHKEMSKVKIVHQRPFEFDSRLF